MRSRAGGLFVPLMVGLGTVLGLLAALGTLQAGLASCQGHDLARDSVRDAPFDRSIEHGVVTRPTRDIPIGVGAQGTVPISQGQVQNLSNRIPTHLITIDGTREGWEQADPYMPSDPSGDNGGVGNVDWLTITMAHDCAHLYVRYEVDDGPSIHTNGARYNLFLDVDRDPATGYRGSSMSMTVGADVLVQGVTVYEFTGATQTSWDWRPIGGCPINEDVLSGSRRDIEYRVPISFLDVLSDSVVGFDWIAWADHTWGGSPISLDECDFYPDGGNSGLAGSFHSYALSYAPRFSLFPNPERGFLCQTNTHDPYGDMALAAYRPLATSPGTSTLRCYREYDGIALIHRNFWLREYVTSPISAEYIDMMQADFDTARAAGLKVVVRFAYTPAYTDPITCAGMSDRYDASKEWILTHTHQLSDVLYANGDVIAAGQAGFIGGWGEWWGSCHFNCDVDPASCCEVLSATLDMLPPDRMVQVRTPRYKYRCFGDSAPPTMSLPITLAHTYTDVARVGHHNDCFLCNPTDAGTYIYTPTEYPYLEQETKYLVMGGETGNFNEIDGTDPNRLKCPTALEELERFHWSFLSYDWYTGTHNIWRDGGCFSDIERRLGYRFVLLGMTCPGLTWSGHDLQLSLQIVNGGYATPYNERPVELILRHTSGLTYPFALADDPRFWLPGEVHTISHTVSITPGLPPGRYELLLNLPDPHPRLRHRPEYAIRLANSCAWEEETGYNRLSACCAYLPFVLRND